MESRSEARKSKQTLKILKSSFKSSLDTLEGGARDGQVVSHLSEPYLFEARAGEGTSRTSGLVAIIMYKSRLPSFLHMYVNMHQN